MSTRGPYPTDLSDDEWEILKPLRSHKPNPADAPEHTNQEGSS
jgi:hypothetical protein